MDGSNQYNQLFLDVIIKVLTGCRIFGFNYQLGSIYVRLHVKFTNPNELYADPGGPFAT